jgi:hypothetical protein
MSSGHGSRELSLGVEDVYMLGLAAVCWATRTTRNSICFEKTECRNPCEIIFLACLFMRYWSDLYLGVKQEMIEKGVQTMIRMAMRVLEKKPPAPAPRLMLTKEDATDDEQDKGGGSACNLMRC